MTGLGSYPQSHRRLKTAVRYLIFTMIAMFTLAGCRGKENDYSETTVTIDKKGVISHRIVESFDKSYYNEDELRGIINDELSAYRAGKDEDSASLVSLEIKDQTATAEIRFASYEDYAKFNDVDFFYGTIGEAVESEYPTDVTLKSSTDDSTISRYEFESMTDSKLVIVSEPVIIETPHKIAYTTANIDVIDERSARMASDSVGLGYIVLK